MSFVPIPGRQLRTPSPDRSCFSFPPRPFKDGPVCQGSKTSGTPAVLSSSSNRAHFFVSHSDIMNRHVFYQRAFFDPSAKSPAPARICLIGGRESSRVLAPQSPPYAVLVIIVILTDPMVCLYLPYLYTAIRKEWVPIFCPP